MTPSLMASAFVLTLIGSVLVVFSRFNALVRSQKRVRRPGQASTCSSVSERA